MSNNKPIDTLADRRLSVTVHPKRGAFQCIEIAPSRSWPCYEVQHHTFCDGGVNTWTITNGDNEDPVPHVFATREQAQAELDEFLHDIQSEIASGDRAPDEGYDASDFRIVAIARDGGAS